MTSVKKQIATVFIFFRGTVTFRKGTPYKHEIERSEIAPFFVSSNLYSYLDTNMIQLYDNMQMRGEYFEPYTYSGG